MAVTQPIDTNSHAGAWQQNIQFIFSKYDNDLRRQKTIDGMREKLLRGDWIGNAPILCTISSKNYWRLIR